MLLGINLLATSCYKNHFYVQQEWIDRSYLASTHVHTPDPRQEHPPSGQQLLVSWDFPRSVFEQKLHLEATIRLWDSTQELIIRPILRKRGYEVFYFPNDLPGTDKRILTYSIRALSERGEVVGYWEHQFWTKLIDIGKPESFSSAQ